MCGGRIQGANDKALAGAGVWLSTTTAGATQETGSPVSEVSSSLYPLSSTIPKKRANGNLISSKSTLAFNTQLFLEPTLSPFLSKSISTWDHGGGPLPCLSESTVHAHALFRRRPPTPAECPTPYQDPCSANPQGPTLPTA